MNNRIHVEGAANLGDGTMYITGGAVGPGAATVNTTLPGPQPKASPEAGSEPCDVGIITVLPEETQAVACALGLRRERAGSLHFYRGEAETDGGRVTVVAVQALSQGENSAGAAYHNLCQRYSPRTVVLAGIAGGIGRGVQPGDVVVATRVVCYDLRKVTLAGTQHRGAEHHAPAETGHSVNAFFAAHDPAEFSFEDPAGVTRVMRMRDGIIGSGNAVIADRGAEIIRYLASFNDKILAVDMEAGGLSQACHEHTAATGRTHGWVIVRGISDEADQAKDDSRHRVASRHAAVAVRHLLPYLGGPPATAGG
jgi:adenosylhomocysteine nucleosidase